jgi:hypothetical protein
MDLELIVDVLMMTVPQHRLKQTASTEKLPDPLNKEQRGADEHPAESSGHILEQNRQKDHPSRSDSRRTPVH